MTTAGWITLIVSVGGVTLLFVWCVVKVLTSPPRDHELAHVEPVETSQADER
jgi:hypothetical protein